MAKFVIKKDGEKEPFDAEKIRASIMAAASNANLPEERRNEVIERVLGLAMQLAEGKEEISTAEIREKVLGELDALEPSVSGAWRKSEQEKQKA
ncbi:MAG: ATP cone domain-containing protein [Candidatus Tagabacteria bacterium]